MLSSVPLMAAPGKLDQRKLDLLSRLLAEELKARREAAGHSKNEVAAMAGLAVSFISYLESGERRPTVESLTRLAWVYDTSASALLASCEQKLGTL